MLSEDSSGPFAAQEGQLEDGGRDGSGGKFAGEVRAPRQV
jgi:hypothetical protein